MDPLYSTCSDAPGPFVKVSGQIPLDLLIYSAVRLNLSNSEDATGLWSKASICQNPSNLGPRLGPYYPPHAARVSVWASPSNYRVSNKM